jgi:predicted CXXCH cytochrome family protein
MKRSQARRSDGSLHPTSLHGGTIPLAWLAMVLSAAGLLWAGCSVQKHYKILSFFFDGVPNPNALPVTGGSGDREGMLASPTYSVHKPFSEDQCDECHRSRARLGTADSRVCLNCHQDVPSQHSHMHGPVVAVACLWCHTAHESALAALLKAEAQKVCAQCHEPAMLSTEREPAHADASRSCLECHTGHGGESRYFLRAVTGGGGGGTRRSGRPRE